MSGLDQLPAVEYVPAEHATQYDVTARFATEDGNQLVVLFNRQIITTLRQKNPSGVGQGPAP
jgi:hypothetical protein